MNRHLHAQIREVLNSANELLTSSLVMAAKHLRSVLPQLGQYSDEELEEMILISMNYEEETVDSFSLADAIGWIKGNFDRTRHGGGCILRGKPKLPYLNAAKLGIDARQEEEATALPGRQAAPKITLQLCFLDRHGEPLLTADSRHKVVHCKTLSPDLERQFGEKDMIILR